MSKALRLSEKWYRRGLWVVAFLLAWFLIGFGGTLVGDLPKVEHQLQLEDFLDQAKANTIQQQLDALSEQQTQVQGELDQAQLQYRKVQSQAETAERLYQHSLSARGATEDAQQNAELLQSRQQLDQLTRIQQKQQQQVQASRQQLLDLRQQDSTLTRQLNVMRQDAQELMNVENRQLELRVFIYRLLLTLPLLLLAVWLFAKQRKARYWPFVWGYTFFALFVFFVELVPYLPSYGGYVRYGVGIVLTLFGGRWAINGLNRYLERQKQAEALPDQERRRSLAYDDALMRLAKSICPGCERQVPIKDGVTDFCPHCGISLFVHCSTCDARKSAFACFCHLCGAKDEQNLGA